MMAGNSDCMRTVYLQNTRRYKRYRYKDLVGKLHTFVFIGVNLLYPSLYHELKIRECDLETVCEFMLIQPLEELQETAFITDILPSQIFNEVLPHQQIRPSYRNNLSSDSYFEATHHTSLCNKSFKQLNGRKPSLPQP